MVKMARGTLLFQKFTGNVCWLDTLILQSKQPHTLRVPCCSTLSLGERADNHVTTSVMSSKSTCWSLHLYDGAGDLCLTRLFIYARVPTVRRLVTRRKSRSKLRRVPLAAWLTRGSYYRAYFIWASVAGGQQTDRRPASNRTSRQHDRSSVTASCVLRWDWGFTEWLFKWHSRQKAVPILSMLKSQLDELLDTSMFL